MSGVSVNRHAKIVAVDSENSDALDAMTTCQHYAVLAFWGLNRDTDCLKCRRFFFVPNPFKRMILRSEKAELSQVLYSSPHTNDVFLYFKGYHPTSPSTLTMHCAILDLDYSEDSRDMKDHCKITYTIEESSLLG